MNKLISLYTNECGAATIEYSLLIAIIALVMTVALSSVGRASMTQYTWLALH